MSSAMTGPAAPSWTAGGLDALRDHAARAAFDAVLVTAPDRLARNFVHQMVVLEELERRGVRVCSSIGRSATIRTSSW
jgi:site-specific DNA recombinase